MDKPDDDFAIDDEAKEVLELLRLQLGLLGPVYTMLLRDKGLTEVQAIGAIAYIMIQDAAYISVKNRIENLDGEPSLERWRRVTDAAWNVALKVVKHEKEPEQNHERP